MEIKKNSDKYSVDWIVKLYNHKRLVKPSFQRAELWNDLRKSNFIISILANIPIEDFIFEKMENGVFSILDGQQRNMAICAYVNNLYPLHPEMEYPVVNGINVVGLTFKQLPLDMQEHITNHQLLITILSDLDEKTRLRVFWARNQGVLLSNMDFVPVLLGEYLMNELHVLYNHEFFLDVAKIPTRAKDVRSDLKIILQYLMLLKDINIDIGDGKKITSFSRDISKEIIDTASIENLLTYLIKAFPKDDRKIDYIKKISNVPYIMVIANEAKNKKMKPETLKKRLDSFFINSKNKTEFYKLPYQDRYLVLKQAIM